MNSIISTYVIIGVCVFLFATEKPNDIFQNCISSEVVINEKQYGRVWWSVLFHASWEHLVYNMISLWNKGNVLERILGFQQFNILVFFSAIVSNILYILAQHSMLKSVNPEDFTAFYGCSVGFSGVLFALQVVINHLYRTGQQSVWMELFLIHLLVPNSSFLGHLCGILAGYLYAWYILPLLSSNQDEDRDYSRSSTRENRSMQYGLLFMVVASILIFSSSMWYSQEHNIKDVDTFFTKFQRDFKIYWEEEISSGDIVHDSMKAVRKWLKLRGWYEFVGEPLKSVEKGANYVSRFIHAVEKGHLIRSLRWYIQNLLAVDLSERTVLLLLVTVLSSLVFSLLWKFTIKRNHSPQRSHIQDQHQNQHQNQRTGENVRRSRLLN